MGKARDVRNTRRSNQHFVPIDARPIKGLICIYAGNSAIISLASTGSQDVNIWWTMTGCQSLDNGIVGATQIANKSFDGFSNTIEGLTG
jgi:hypothetical protein